MSLLGGNFNVMLRMLLFGNVNVNVYVAARLIVALSHVTLRE